MFSPVLSIFVLAMSTQIYANNDRGASSGSETTTIFQSFPSTFTVATPSATSVSIPIFSCLAYVSAISDGTASATSFTIPTVIGVTSSVLGSPVTSTVSFITTDRHGGATTTTFSGPFATTSTNDDFFSSSSSSSFDDSRTRPLTSTVWATVATSSGIVSTIYATGTVSIANPSALPICNGSPVVGGTTSTIGVSSSSTNSASPSGSQAALNDSNGDNKPSSGIMVKNNVAGLVLGVFAGITLTML